jgi:hypothetical protein
MRQVKGNEKQGRDILNGHKGMSSARINEINAERRERLSAEEAQGRAELERQNASISMFSED